ncbi:hypothetical protein [Erinnyis ello granulovirus]|uniref:P18 n=1 Tax=Erinnyis ello granulovirus TaxID=307444 RepID=A0A097DAN6_9BBAC|nr:hypothetical protein [Erinnyis ello granulovirus]AIS92084.1 hypothetical protein [Erinnyis ello granulovirus]ARX71424.1 hypothetical protein EREL_085 [Erinnyis ello granulovirus]ARX71554.1 hypothetical protein EREL_085 [Erinnyis ello granulovirus]ARX71684.1 hypothetical protein EREL_085 [Erinnyis ello granulovirus]ARX71814.1 hypothetical protein EREL_085 [Erinnyis ello granulovirus]
MSLNLYTYKPSSNTMCNDTIITEHNETFHIQGILEALYDTSKSKFACFLELKREQCTLLQKLNYNLLYQRTGNFYRNHVLLDVLNLYNKYVEEFDDGENAFNTEVVQICHDTVVCVFELFSCATNIVVFLKSDVDDTSPIVEMLQFLENNSYITTIKTVCIQ